MQGLFSRAFRVVTFAATMALSALAVAVGFTPLGWPDLTYPIEPQDDPFFGLDYEQRRHLETVLGVLRQRDQGSAVSAQEASLAEESRIWLDDHGLNADQLVRKERALLEKIALQRNSSRAELAGKSIRILGYVIPLEFSGNRATEFLLVPYYGACVHTPPPPPNQIIYVSSDVGVAIEGPFSAVSVEGLLGVERQNRIAQLSDGTSGFEVGYSLEAQSVRTLPTGSFVPHQYRVNGHSTN